MSTYGATMNGYKALRLDRKPVESRNHEIRRHTGRSARMFATIVFVITDLTTVLLCFCVVLGFFGHESMLEYLSFLSYYLLYSPLFAIGFGICGLYPGFCMAPAEELRRFTVTSFLANTIGLVISAGINGKFGRNDEVFIYAWLISIPVLTVSRVLSRAVASRSPLWGVPAVVFGAGKEARVLVDRLLRCRWIGYRPGFMLDNDRKPAENYRGIPILHNMAAGLDRAKKQGYSTALVALPAAGYQRYKDVIQRYVKAFPTFILFSDFAALAGVWSSVRDFEGILGLSTTQRLLIHGNAITKRIIDLLGVIIGGSVLLLPFLLLMLLVKVDSPGPIFYGHRRLGKGGREIHAWKFRSMKAGADKQITECFVRDSDLKDEWNSKHKMKNDPRVTIFGKFLRKTSLDELPQLLNVLKGEMSLVGPRPIVAEEIQHYGSSWDEVSNVLPGMTGLWQVSGRSETGYTERVEQDMYYIQNWSIWLDLFILFKTIWIVVTGKGAY
jgi:Undecaprenyl-phosphate galactose phosphotransferase WbaP